MKVSEILKKNEVTISCEIFPPKQGAQLQNYKAIAAEIAKLKPAYISCTYGATGGTSDYTVEIADAINSYNWPSTDHGAGYGTRQSTIRRDGQHPPCWS